jgi:hypothetical protein
VILSKLPLVSKIERWIAHNRLDAPLPGRNELIDPGRKRKIDIGYPATVMGCSRNVGVSPSERDIRVMIGSFGHGAHAVYELKAFCKIRELEMLYNVITLDAPALKRCKFCGDMILR